MTTLFQRIRELEPIAEREIANVAKVAGVSRAQLLAPTRGRPKASLARQLVMYRLRMLHSMSYPHIAAVMGRDPATVIYGIRRVHSLLEAAA